MSVCPFHRRHSSPIIGGVFSSPAVRWPDTLGKLTFLQDHPYFLPCFIASAIACLAFLCALVGLKEVSTFVSALYISQTMYRPYFLPYKRNVGRQISWDLDRLRLQASSKIVMSFNTAQFRVPCSAAMIH